MSENGNKTPATTLAPSDDLKIPKDYKEHFRVCSAFLVSYLIVTYSNFFSHIYFLLINIHALICMHKLIYVCLHGDL